MIDWLDQYDECVINIDKLTWHGNQNNLSTLKGCENHIFFKADIGDTQFLKDILCSLSAESSRQFCS